LWFCGLVVLWSCCPFLASGSWLLASGAWLLSAGSWDPPARCLARTQEMMRTFERCSPTSERASERLRLKIALRLRGVVARSLVFVPTSRVGGARHSRRRHVRPRVPPPSAQVLKCPSVQVWRMWRMGSVWRHVAAGVVWMSRIGVCVCVCGVAMFVWL